MATKIKTKKDKLSECCGARMIGGVQCENCGSDGKFTTGTAIIKRLDAILAMVGPETFNREELEKPAERFVDCGDHIKDTWEHTNPQTGAKYRLMWAKVDAPKKLTNEVGGESEKYCEKLCDGGFKDWKLPDRWELETLLDLNKRDPACDSVLNMKTDDWYWTKTGRAANTTSAWSVYFNFGYVYVNFRYVAYYVRPVRQY